MRAWMVRLHRWFGLFAATFLTVAGLTGALIAWDHEIDGWLNPELYDAATTGPAQDPVVLAARLEAADPRLQVTWLPLAVEPGHSLLLWVVPRTDPQTGQPFHLDFNQVALNPVTGDVQARREWGAFSLSRAHLMPFLYKLHYSLHLPSIGPVELGVWLMGGIAIAWVLDTLIALWISFPNRAQWRRSLAFRWAQGGHKLVFDLHRSGGVWLWVLVLIVAITSVDMNLGSQVVKPLVNVFSPLTESKADSMPPAPAGSAVTLATQGHDVIARAQAIAAERGWSAPVGSLYIRPGSHAWTVSFHEAGNSHGDIGLGNVQLDLDAATGGVLGSSVPGEGSAGDVFLQTMFPLHSGRIIGTAGRVLVTLLGLAIATFSVTGVLIWARKRKARLHAERSRAQRPTRVSNSAT